MTRPLFDSIPHVSPGKLVRPATTLRLHSLAIARALMSCPKLFLLDEPSLGLAPLIVQRIGELIREIQRTECLAVILAEQNALWAMGIARRTAVIELGRIRLEGASDALRNDENVRKAYLGT